MKNAEIEVESSDDPNAEPIVFRVPKRLKDELQTCREFEMFSSLGELMRGLARQHVLETEAKAEFKWWTERRQRSGTLSITQPSRNGSI